ncbi:nucleoside diphosphate kinase B [Sphaeroforma arctica JP610]|uniref:Nucleoside diphosphate kinase n=1 Tax=Sphaeroforma arctica JP610 TaxID=667725 RepID=A0A0L0FLB1_9EUKA|nr:nucleoside diphosphate kinase B [Sphaeroforma arctica JP610]KNC77555.1 nucleoside diphosphate kinase B [Sphaeroforma arctica JP610]|eukprot:XP_014151457.1 nucleoside diphosphate kinase B [Sphaeroforma arctica JP610]
MERTFIAIKPDGVARGLVAKIIKRFEQRGYKLVALKMVKPSDAHLREHYADLAGKGFFNGLIEYMKSGPIVAMVWAGENACAGGRMLLGETNPQSSLPGSIRGDYSLTIGRNICHGSDSVESAEKEIALWFGKDEICDWELPVHSLLYE